MIEAAPVRAKPRVRMGPGFSQMDWMKLTTKAKGKSLRGVDGPQRGYTLDEVRKHNNMGMDAWMIVHGRVYNVTKYAPYHPGGVDELARGIGDDASALFDEIHPWVSESMLDACVVGWVVKDGIETQPRKKKSILGRLSPKRDAKKSPAIKEVGDWFPCELVSKTPSCKYCMIVRVKVLEREHLDESLHRPGCYLMLRQKIGGKIIERPFTPFLPGNEASELGLSIGLAPNDGSYLDLFMKVYKDGQMTDFLNTASAGECLESEVRFASYHLYKENESLCLGVRGAAGFRKATGSGISHICMIASGTGVMPMIQTLQYLQGANIQGTSASLILAAREEGEIPFQSEFQNRGKLTKTTYVVSCASSDSWEGKVGRINSGIIEDHLSNGATYSTSAKEESAEQPAIRFFICGSFNFNASMESILVKLGWPSSSIVRID